MHDSASPKLCEMTSPMWWSITYFVVARRSESLLLAASARMMLAPGAITWAHSTSRVSSPPQPTWLSSVGSNAGTAFGCWRTVKLGGSGTPNEASSSATSPVGPVRYGFAYASMITIVLPVPSTPDASRPE